MNFKYSKDEKILKRINELNNFRKIYLSIMILIIINSGFAGFVYNKDFFSMLSFLIVLIFLNAFVYFITITNVVRESIEKELKPKLFINIGIWFTKHDFKKGQNHYSALLDLSLGYILDGKFEEAEKILSYLEKQPLKKYNKQFFLFRKIELYFYKKDYNKIKKLEKELKYELKKVPKLQRKEMIDELEMIDGIISKDTNKLKQVCKRLGESNKNIDRAHYLYIKSLFFEEADNKYQKMLAFEGGNLFFAKEEYEDQNITTKNNMKPNKHKWPKIIQIIMLLFQICLLISSILVIFL
ncbi:MAG: hypothetical protein IJN90_03590 [Bacilli bacterium]|nr:hypothetical protein [Bacilli bacterium]